MPAVIVLTAPSGAGKTTIARHVMEAVPELRFSVSATTRAPRQGEQDGVDYHFLTQEQFEQYRDEDKLLEYEEVYPGCFYGTLRSDVERSSPDEPVLLDIDVKGAMTVKDIFDGNALVLFISPPSLEVLAERLENRNTETEDALRQRLQRSKLEMQFADQCDAVVVNDDLQLAVEETLDRIQHFLNSKRTDPSNSSSAHE